MWKRELGSVNDFIVDGNRIYLVDQNDRVMALTIDGGVTLWTQSDLLHRLLTDNARYIRVVVKNRKTAPVQEPFSK